MKLIPNLSVHPSRFLFTQVFWTLNLHWTSNSMELFTLASPFSWQVKTTPLSSLVTGCTQRLLRYMLFSSARFTLAPLRNHCSSWLDVSIFPSVVQVRVTVFSTSVLSKLPVASGHDLTVTAGQKMFREN